MAKNSGLGVTLLVACFILAGAVYTLWSGHQREDAVGLENLPKTTVKREDISETIVLRGVLIAARKVPIFSETSGQIVKLHVEEGQSVKKGEVLLEFDQSQVDNEVEKQKMSVEKAGIRLKNDEDSLTRKKALFDENFIPETELVEAQKRKDLSKIDYSMEQKELETLTDQLGKGIVRAPITGVVSSKKVVEGEVITTTANSAYGKMLLEITDTSLKKIQLYVSQIERKKIADVKEVAFWFDAENHVKRKGVISRISDAAISRNGINQFEVEIDIEGVSKEFLLGINANIEVVAARRENVLTLPVQAVFMDFDSRTFVYLKKDDSFEKCSITTGISSTNKIEVTSGLAEGQEVFLEEPELPAQS
jgi:HlyD family secretion protein